MAQILTVSIFVPSLVQRSKVFNSMPRLVLTLNAIVFLMLVPLLELNSTHLWNPGWPPHARLHEAWQLLTNSMLSVFILWLCWRKNELISALIVSGCMTWAFLIAILLSGKFHGSMGDSVSSRVLIGGTNPAILVAAILGALLAATLIYQVVFNRNASRARGASGEDEAS